LQDDQSSRTTIFAIDDDLAFRLAFEAVSETLPGRKIDQVEGAVRGYHTTFRFALDTYSQQVLVFPVLGRTSSGDEVRGCYYEVSGSGSSFVQGRAKNVELFECLIGKARLVGNPVIVDEITATTYQPRNLGASTQSGGLAKRLTQLKQLLDQGLITQQDYDTKKAELLRDM
tara:strand:+ start:2065 stop:2580 length:516 start_codon:yes stop_codon:yes gene_type:complete